MLVNLLLVGLNIVHKKNYLTVANKYKDASLNFFHGQRVGLLVEGEVLYMRHYLSQPPGSVNGRTRVTEQGEVIQQKYGSESMAEYSLRYIYRCSY